MTFAEYFFLPEHLITEINNAVFCSLCLFLFVLLINAPFIFTLFLNL